MLGAHQKIDRVARVHLRKVLPKGTVFPSTRDILHFEGNNGPDGIKRKSPAKDEPWHYIDPTNPKDCVLIEHISNHSHNLTVALAEDNYERASFEAAWLAHAIVDGLTPAHHYPLSEKIEELWGHPKEFRTSFKQKNFIKGHNYRDTVMKNWEYWGAKGVFTTHFMFEFGFATTIATLKIPNGKPNPNELIRVQGEGIIPYFREAAMQVYGMQMYETFHKSGWTRKLARQTKLELAPLITKIVTLAWFEAAMKAQQLRSTSNEA
ncbi:hypothetical protein CYG49_00905 [Candidatus Saccharibacteria bacterium]|nr:MAG: hypothetical protein CYG49_00905 [Candidatus Saccharibacteria bacterium]